METPNYRKASIYFDDETVLEVEQRGGGGSGVGGDTGLSAVNLITGESTNAALAEKDETIEAQAATIEEQAGTIEQQAGEISDLEDEVAAKQAIIDAFPAIEALNVTANGTYNEEGKAYKPVTVNVPEGLRYIFSAITKQIGFYGRALQNTHVFYIPAISTLANGITYNTISRLEMASGGARYATINWAVKNTQAICEIYCDTISGAALDNATTAQGVNVTYNSTTKMVVITINMTNFVDGAIIIDITE